MTDPITLKELKEFCNQIPDSELDRPLKVGDVQDGTQYHIIVTVLEDSNDDESYSIGFDSTRALE